MQKPRRLTMLLLNSAILLPSFIFAGVTHAPDRLKESPHGQLFDQCLFLGALHGFASGFFQR